MQSTVFLFLVASVIGTVQSQTWAGTYTPDSTCSTSACCCLSGQVVVTSASANTYTVNSGTNGVCGGVNTFTGTAHTDGYTGWMVVTDNNTLTLSSDSNTINVISPSNAACSGQGVKSGVIKQHPNIIMLFTISLISMMMSALKM
ncbi:unnamed protein product [Adineta steineri]|uniref:Uncharacterized protein n=1 Tax=Adineta steineri TaxID=433720 RepID=A0A814D7I4_9BILA|nr:unnamed protein product [Adineta steineri]CAF4095294.1 unnamed protein product [Adineta steineri]